MVRVVCLDAVGLRVMQGGVGYFPSDIAAQPDRQLIQQPCHRAIVLLLLLRRLHRLVAQRITNRPAT